MSETLQETQEEPSKGIDIDALKQKEQAALAGEMAIEDFSEEELEALDELHHPNRETDINKAHEIALAINGQETGMARSKRRIEEAEKAIADLYDSKEGASFLKRLSIDRRIKQAGNDIADVDNVEYWDEVTAQRDKRAAEAAAKYDNENPK